MRVRFPLAAHMNRLLWLVSFLVGVPSTLVASVLLFLTLSSPVVAPISPIAYKPLVLGANSLSTPSLSTFISLGDARAQILENYLTRYNSPLKQFSRYLVATADKYSLDFRLLVAIAQQESNLCKRIPPDSYNCWGFGIYGDKVTRFDSYEQAIEIVSKTLKEKYVDKGLNTPEEIMAKYTPPSVEIGGPWARGVNQFLAEME